jgi:uncharacterized protein DUF6335
MAKKKARKRPAAAKARPRRSAARPKARKAKPARRPARKAAAAAKKRPARAARKKRTAAAVTKKRTAAAVVKKKKTAASSRKAIPQVALPPRHAPSLDRARKQLREIEENVPTPPSSLDLDRTPSAARSGRREMRETILEHNETGPELTGGDVDADWQDAYSVGDEAPGGDNPTPDQDRVDDIGKALGVEYQDNEELRGSDKITDRDRHRWELDPASSEDYRDRD